MTGRDGNLPRVLIAVHELWRAVALLSPTRPTIEVRISRNAWNALAVELQLASVAPVGNPLDVSAPFLTIRGIRFTPEDAP